MFSWKTGTGGVLALQKLEQENWCKIAQLRRNAFCLLHNHRLTGWRPSLHGHILYIQKWIKKLVMKNQCLCIVHHYIICLAVEMAQLMIKIYQNLSIFHYVGLSQRQYLWNSTWNLLQFIGCFTLGIFTGAKIDGTILGSGQCSNLVDHIHVDVTRWYLHWIAMSSSFQITRNWLCRVLGLLNAGWRWCSLFDMQTEKYTDTEMNHIGSCPRQRPSCPSAQVYPA